MAQDATTVPGMLDERRGNLTRQRNRTVNQLYALLRELLPGGVSTDLTADRARAALTGIRLASPMQRGPQGTRPRVGRRHPRPGCRIKVNTQRMQDASPTPEVV